MLYIIQRIRTSTFFFFVGGFVKFRKATVSLVMSVCLSVWNNSASTQRIFMKSDIKIFRKSVEKIEVLLHSEKNNVYFTYGLKYSLLYLIHWVESFLKS